MCIRDRYRHKRQSKNMLDRSFSYFCSCKRQCGAPLYLISQLEQMPRVLRNLKKKTRVMSQPIKTKPMATFRVSFSSLFAKTITHSPKGSWYFERKKSFRSVGEFYSSKLLKRRTWIIPNANVDFASLSVVSGKEFPYSIHRSQHL